MKLMSMWTAGLLAAMAGGVLALAEGQSFSGNQLQQKLEAPGANLAAFFNLKTGTGRTPSPQITVVTPTIDSDLDGFFETVLKVNLDPASGYTTMILLADYDGVPTGFTLNIGDSASNNGGGGDAATQQRDAELQVQDEALSVYTNDLGGTPAAATRMAQSLVRLNDGGLKVTVADKFVCWGNAYSELNFKTAPPTADLLYALSGQPDSEGPVNYDVYVGLNRVIFGAPANGRIGAGLARVYIRLE